MGYDSLMPVDVNNTSILLCAHEDIHHSSRTVLRRATSPLMCLSAATENSYDAIILYMVGNSLTRTASMIELCAVLKKNHYTSTFPILAVCFAVNRQIIEHLKEANVDFVVFKKNWGEIDLDANPVAFKQFMKVEYSPAQVLKGLCPYIHYAPINTDKELITCEAYVNWLVLGPRRLKDLCQTPDYPSCPYYQSPRLPE